MRYCPKCERDTPRTADGRQCRPCTRRRQREWKRRKYATNPGYRLRYSMANTLYDARRAVERSERMVEEFDAEIQLQG